MRTANYLCTQAYVVRTCPSHNYDCCHCQQQTRLTPMRLAALRPEGCFLYATTAPIDSSVASFLQSGVGVYIIWYMNFIRGFAITQSASEAGGIQIGPCEPHCNSVVGRPCSVSHDPEGLPVTIDESLLRCCRRPCRRPCRGRLRTQPQEPLPLPSFSQPLSARVPLFVKHLDGTSPTPKHFNLKDRIP